MNVIILGAGNVASVLSKKIKNAGHRVVQIFNHTLGPARQLATELDGADYTDDIMCINRMADIYIIAIKDSAIQLLENNLYVEDKLVVHTAGSVPKIALEKIPSRYGVLYPVQSLRKGMDIAADIPFLIDGSDECTTESIESFARSISQKISKADDTERLKLHVAAVVVSNFSNHLYVLAEDYCKAEQLDFNLLKPLIIETAERINRFPPREVQTGPALRNDFITLEKHLRVLSAYPKLKYIYLKMTDSIINIDKH